MKVLRWYGEERIAQARQGNAMHGYGKAMKSKAMVWQGNERFSDGMVLIGKATEMNRIASAGDGIASKCCGKVQWCFVMAKFSKEMLSQGDVRNSNGEELWRSGIVWQS